MAANIYDWSVVAANNSNSDADMTWAEGQAPSTVNNSARVILQRGKQLLVDIGGSIAAAGTANGLTVTASSPFTAYADGMIISFRATASNTAAATLSVNGIGAKAIRKMGTTADVALDSGDIVSTGIYVAQYSAALNGAAGAWLLINATRAGKAPTVQLFPAGATWTNPGCRVADFEGQGGGGGSGGVDGQGSGTSGASGGGGSGFYGRTGPISVIGVASAVVTIGAAGAAGASGANAGGNGGNTAITINATTYTWGGGVGSSGYLSNLSNNGGGIGGKGGAGTNVSGFSVNGSRGDSQADAAAGRGTGGDGGHSGFGRGGQGGHTIGVGVAGGEGGQGAGAGAGGSVTNNTTSDTAGVAGSIGYMRVTEYY